MSHALAPTQSPAKTALLFVLGAAIFAAAYTQAPLYYSNQNQYFLQGLAAAGHGLLHEDWLANTDDPTPFFSGLVAVSAAYLHPWTFHVYYALLMGGYAAAMLALFVAVVGRTMAAVRWPLFLALFVAVHSALARWLSYRWLALEDPWYLDYPWYLQAGLAGQYVLGGMFQPSTFGVLLVVAIALFAHGRPLWAAVCVALAATLHSTYLLPGALLTVGFVAALTADGRPRLALGTGALAFALVLPAVAYVLLRFLPSSPEAFAEAQDILVNLRIPHHTRPDLWLDGIAVFQLGWIVLSLFLIRRTPWLLVLAIPFALMLLLTAAQVVTGSHTLALLFPWRISAVLVPVATTVILARLVGAAPRMVEGKAAWLTCGLMIVGLAAAGIGLTVARVGFRVGEEEVPLMDFVRRTRAPGQTYLVPVRVPNLAASTRGSLSGDFKPHAEKRRDARIIPLDLQRFRLYTGAPIYVDFKSIPYQDKEVIEWRDRLRFAELVQDKIGASKFGEVSTELRARGITHLVVPAGQGLENDELERIYGDAYYQVFRFRDVPSD